MTGYTSCLSGLMLGLVKRQESYGGKETVCFQKGAGFVANFPQSTFFIVLSVKRALGSDCG